MGKGIGRNEPCPCGSGLKFKKCGLLQGHGYSADSLSESYNLLDRNNQIVDAVHEVFGPIGEDILSLKTRMTNDRVRAFYRVMDSISPKELNPYPLLAPTGGGLRALYNGDARPELLAQNIFRFTLYADQILIVEPFITPGMTRPKFNPIKNPEQYRADTLKLAFLTLALEPWLRLGIVQFIPDPTDFDLRLKSLFLDLAAKRYGGPDAVRPDDVEQDLTRLEPFMKREFVRTMAVLPRDSLARNLARQGFNPDSIPGMIDYMKAQLKADPLAIEDPDLDKGELLIQRSAGNLETTLLITEMAGAFPYTDSTMRWRELLGGIEDANDVTRLWTPLTKAFSELPFRFLNGVDPAFAFRMREEERLLQLRTFLRRLWNTLSASPDASTIDEKARVFSEELQSEYETAKADWNAIENEFKNSTISAAWLAGLAAIGGALATGYIGVGLSAMGFAISTLFKAFRYDESLEEFRHKVPMSVFIDLDTKQFAPF
jgi:hypothetical protein